MTNTQPTPQPDLLQIARQLAQLVRHLPDNHHPDRQALFALAKALDCKAPDVDAAQTLALQWAATTRPDQQPPALPDTYLLLGLTYLLACWPGAGPADGRTLEDATAPVEPAADGGQQQVTAAAMHLQSQCQRMVGAWVDAERLFLDVITKALRPLDGAEFAACVATMVGPLNSAELARDVASMTRAALARMQPGAGAIGRAAAAATHGAATTVHGMGEFVAVHQPGRIAEKSKLH